jgi:ATP-dependent DNA helicase RecQ
LNTLEQAGYISFSENVFLPAKAGFIVTKESLYDFEKNKPLLEPAIKALLRSYEGIFDNLVNISEKTIAGVLKIPEAEVINLLQELARFSIIIYNPKKDSPQLFFLYNRIPASQVMIDAKFYRQRKQLYQYKIDEMIGYAGNTTECRSTIIRKYFGDTQIEPCGICDICLAKKKLHLPEAEVSRIANLVMEKLPTHNTISLLQQQLKLPQTHLERALDYLIREEKISWNADGKFLVT